MVAVPPILGVPDGAAAPVEEDPPELDELLLELPQPVTTAAHSAVTAKGTASPRNLEGTIDLTDTSSV
jgi:hypothetical protein